MLATPIGNLEDLSDRAKRILAEVDLVVAEDTRRSAKILNYLNISKPLISVHEHTSSEKISHIISELSKGKSIAYLSDAGTPGLADPGGKLVSAALKEEIKVTPIPGPSALTTLISAAPFEVSEFLFLGYFPKKKGREKIIEKITSAKMPVFFYESPHRIIKTLEHLKNRLDDYNVLIGRELTKVFEEIIFTNLDDPELIKIRPQGEFVIALVKAD